MNYPELADIVKSKPLPSHIAIIMDGNGRWARRNKLSRLLGHRKGTEAVREIVEASVEIGLPYLTIYAFSTENWRRSRIEVTGLLQLIMDSLVNNIAELHKNNIIVRFVGSTDRLPKAWREKADKICSGTWGNTGMRFQIAMNYGSRHEIIHAVNRVLSDRRNSDDLETPVTEEELAGHFFTQGLPDPDLLIRTSGEQRLSNFLLWQSAYTEFWFTNTLWPDFGRIEYLQAINSYQTRNRRFGGR